MSSGRELPRGSPSLPLRLLTGFGLLALATAAGWWLSDRGPRATFAPSDRAGALAPDLRSLRERAVEQENAYDQVSAAGDAPVGDQLAYLVAAVEAQREYVRRQAEPSWVDRERLRHLEVKLANARALIANAESDRLEKEGAAHEAAGEREAAQAAYAEALRQQAAVNASLADDDLKRPGRETLLGLRIEEMAAQPLAAEVGRLLETAHAESADSAARLDALQRAAEIQARINREFARTEYAGTARLDAIEIELASLAAEPLAQERDRLARDAAGRDAAGDAEGAAGLLAKAKALQARIDREFPRSRFSDPSQQAKLEAMRQTALSRAEVAAIDATLAQVDTALRERHPDRAMPLIEQAAARAEDVARRFPSSSALSALQRPRLAFLVHLAPELERVQAAVLDHLRAIPGRAEGRMLAFEVPQALFILVMGSNPSRAAGDALPVESLTAAEAEEFCQRLSWVLGRQVRLPTRAEFAAAMAAEGGSVWTAERSAGAPRDAASGEPNEAGFRNLRGNVAEWVRDPDNESYLVAGGSYADPQEMSSDLFRPAAATERFRTVGFRVVVESP